ncbi:uncharacterized protein LOC136072356 [Hydra vulgaris]|uniref:uncharacterized protein LOC136072356 n=1 Tax=Hydra vulgaris TaxID=6087 RepID=UPI0032EA0E9B
MDDYESLIFNFRNKHIGSDENTDPDINYFNDLKVDCFYHYASELKEFLSKNGDENKKIRIVHINIRSMNKNFENLRHFIEETKNYFDIICLTETWCSQNELNNNSNFHFPNFETILLERQLNKRGGGILIYIKQNIAHNVRNDLCVSDGDKEIVTIEILNNKSEKLKSKSILLSCCYRPPGGASENLSLYLKHNVFHKGNKEKKKNFVIGDLIMDCLRYSKNKKMKKFYDEIFVSGAIPLLNRPTRITENSTTLIDNILTINIYNNDIQIGIIKSDISDRFPIFLTINTISTPNINKSQTIRKRIFNKKNLEAFKYQLSLLNWKHINFNEDINAIYNKFFNTFFSVYDANFPVSEITLKPKTLSSPWITKGLKKSSKIKQKLYIKYLKTKSHANLRIYKNYKTLFEKIRKNLKKNYYSNLITKYKNDSKQIWKILKEITGKQKTCSNFLPKMIKINNVYEPNEIAKEFNKYYTDIGSRLADRIPSTSISFNDFLTTSNNLLSSHDLFLDLSIEEFERAFKS